MDEEIKKLIETNIQLTQQALGDLAKVNRYIFWQKIVTFIYLFLIVAPIIFALIYLPPLLGSSLEQYQDILETLK
jgi:hypothetical protein